MELEQPMTIDESIALARRAHAGQTDLAGLAYIDHPLRVMASIESGSPSARMVAVLHDVLEDTTVTVDDLRNARCPTEVIDAVVALTRRAGETYPDFIARLAADENAVKVKFADLADNSDEARLALLPPEAAARLRTKYSKGNSLLEYWATHFMIVRSEVAHPNGYYRYFRNHNELIGLMRQWQWDDGPFGGGGWPEYLHPRTTGGLWCPGTAYELDAISGMGEDLWSCGEGSDGLTAEAARALAGQMGVDLDAPRGSGPLFG